MARIPGAPDLGGLQTPASGRPVGTFDVTGYARGAAAIAQGAENLGAGIAKFGAGAEELGSDINRWQFTKAHSDFTARKIDLDAAIGKDGNYGPDDSGKDMPARYTEQLNGIRASSANIIQDPRMRSMFIDRTGPAFEQGVVAAQAHARSLSNDAQTAYVGQMGDKAIEQGIATKDEETRRHILDTHNELIDGLSTSGAISDVQARQMKADFAHRFVTADIARRAQDDPQGVINELRVAPGSRDDVVNRIISLEGTASNDKTSARGVGGFTDETWASMIRKYRPELAAGKSDDDLQLYRADKGLARDMVGKLVDENGQALKGAGLADSPGNIRLAHFLGPAAAKAVITADPKQPVDAVLAKAVGPDKAKAMIEANPTILQGQLAGSVKAWAEGQMGGYKPGGGSAIEFLKPEVREQLLARALAERDKQNTVDLSDFKQKIADQQSEAMRTGDVTKPMTLSDFIGRLGAEDGPAAYKSYQANVQLGRDVTRVSSLTYQEQQGLLASYEPKPGEGFAAAAKRQDLLAKEIDAVRKQRLTDPDFKARIESTMAEANANGTVAKPMTVEEFNTHFGPDAGPKAFAAYTSNLRLGRDAKHAGELTPSEQNALLGDYAPKAGSDDFTEQQERQQTLLKAITHVNKERDEDPAGFAVTRLPAAAEAYQRYAKALGDATLTPGQKAVAARSFAATTLLAQQGVGIPDTDSDILPAADVAQIKKAFDDAASSDDPKARTGLIGKVQAMQDMWGDYWPDVVRQLTPSMQPTVRAIAAGADPAAMARLLSLDPKENPQAILKEQSETKAKDVRVALNTEMAPFLSSLVGRQKDRDFFDYYNLADKLSALYARDGKDAGAAAHDAFGALIGNRYDFRDTYRIPKDAGVSADDVQAGAVAAKNMIGGSPTIQPNIEKATADLKLTPQEQALYQRHLTNLSGPGGVDNPDGSRSTLFQAVQEHDGKFYNVPTVWNGKIETEKFTNEDGKTFDVPNKTALANIEREGWDRFPSYATPDEADRRYDKMHAYMERDTEQLLNGRRSNPMFNVRPSRDDVGGMSDARGFSLDAWKRDGQWVTSPHNDGLNLTDGTKFMRDAQGRPLFLSWAQLAQIGGSKEARAAAAARDTDSSLQP